MPWGKLFDPVLPSIFLGWAKSLEIPVSAELVAAMEARGTLITDWKALYEKLRELYDNAQATNAELERERREATDGQNRLIGSLKAQVASFEAAEAEAAQSSAKELGTREQDGVLKLVIGMAVAGYRYDPRAERSPHVAEIANDLSSIGLTLDHDTMRKWLRRAAELLPPDYKGPGG